MIFIDWSKAYDRVDYEWLDGNLVAFGFGEKSLRALRTTWRGFDLRVIGINGISEAFKREQGMAQGCPGAPLLFVFAEEPLSCELQRRLTGILVAIPGQNSQVALGADDVMITVKTSKKANKWWKNMQKPVVEE